MPKVNTLTPKSPLFPPELKVISSIPAQIHLLGNEELLSPSLKRVTIVGSRKVSPYGREVTTMLAEGLARAGVCIVSGLAFGVDSIAHQAALDAKGATIAVLPSSVLEPNPKAHIPLAREIIRHKGLLLSEYPPGTPSLRPNYIARDRLIAGLSEVVLITEAAEKSGSLHTARFALEQGKTVMAVPGPITSPTSQGTNNLIKQGATPVTSLEDVLFALHLAPSQPKLLIQGDTPEEVAIIALLQDQIHDGDTLLEQSRLSTPVYQHTMTMLELKGVIRALGANQWSL